MRFWPSSKRWDQDEDRCSCNTGHAGRRPVMRVPCSASAFARWTGWVNSTAIFYLTLDRLGIAILALLEIHVFEYRDPRDLMGHYARVVFLDGLLWYALVPFTPS